MIIREALSIIFGLDNKGNHPGSDRQATTYNNAVAEILKEVGVVTERPNGANNYPSMIADGVNYQIKTSKGSSPMWNESIVNPDSVLILNLSFGTVIVHGSLITTEAEYNTLTKLKESAANILRDNAGKLAGNFQVAGGRVQFKDSIDWKKSRADYLLKTIKILEKQFE